MATGNSQPPSHGGLSSLGRRPATPASPPYLAFPRQAPSLPVRSFRLPQVRVLLHQNRVPLVAASMESSPPGYRRNVAICLVNPDNKGGIEGEEDARNAAFRELKEETGDTSAEILAEVPYWLTYDFPPEAKEKLNKLWGTDWKGQAQKWFLFRFTRGEDEINLTGDGSEKPEFGEWMWMTPEQLTECAVDFKKSVYEEVLKSFKPHLRPDSDSEE